MINPRVRGGPPHFITGGYGASNFGRVPDGVKFVPGISQDIKVAGAKLVTLTGTEIHFSEERLVNPSQIPWFYITIILPRETYLRLRDYMARKERYTVDIDGLGYRSPYGREETPTHREIVTQLNTYWWPAIGHRVEKPSKRWGELVLTENDREDIRKQVAERMSNL